MKLRVGCLVYDDPERNYAEVDSIEKGVEMLRRADRLTGGGVHDAKFEMFNGTEWVPWAEGSNEA